MVESESKFGVCRWCKSTHHDKIPAASDWGQCTCSRFTSSNHFNILYVFRVILQFNETFSREFILYNFPLVVSNKKSVISSACGACLEVVLEFKWIATYTSSLRACKLILAHFVCHTIELISTLKVLGIVSWVQLFANPQYLTLEEVHVGYIISVGWNIFEGSGYNTGAWQL